VPATKIPSYACEESAMLMMGAFLAGDGSTETPDERATCRDELATGSVSRHGYHAQRRQSGADLRWRDDDV
jgi:hypothetical protein